MKLLPRQLQFLAWAALVLAAAQASAQLLNELKVNPPGTNDAPNEFIEIKGNPGMSLTNIQILALDGNTSGDPGKLLYTLNLTTNFLGSNGLAVVVAPNHPYNIAPATTVIAEPSFGQPGGALGNGTISFLLLFTASTFQAGQDLDKGDNGVLEGLPVDATILDAVGWSDGDKNDIVYGGVNLALRGVTPDAATRFPGNDAPRAASAWFYGSLAGPAGSSLEYDSNHLSGNFPVGTLLTPGATNNTAPVFEAIVPVSGVIGDPFNPVLDFTVSDQETPGSDLLVAASSSNPSVVPDANLVITAGFGGAHTLSLNPVGVGYANITLYASDGSMTGKVSFPYAASAAGLPGTVWLEGASDGSTALALDSDYMLVGDDENQSIRLYCRAQSGLPLRQFDMNPFLALTDLDNGQPREVDIEASTRIGNRLVWTGSHGHGDAGELRPNRCRIFATDVSGVGTNCSLTFIGHYDYLKADLINWDNHNLHGKGTNYYGLEASDAAGVLPKEEDGSGFSIEGLAMMPGRTNGAFVAFRAPIVPATNRNYALIVPVLNLVTLAASGGAPGSSAIGAPIELDLYGRGIRSLEGSSNGYFIVGGTAGGAPGAYPQDFRLYSWTGNAADQPQQRTAHLSGLGPEGIVEVPGLPWTPATTLQLLTDCGGTVFYADGVKAKNLTTPNFKKCRTDLVACGAITKPAPLITSANLKAGTMSIRWRALRGESYSLEVASTLCPADWTVLATNLIAPGPYAAHDVTPAGSQRFYRVAVANAP